MRKTWSAEAIRELRQRLGLSQAEFARQLGVRQQTVSEWETGRYLPRGASTTVLRIFAEQHGAYDAAYEARRDVEASPDEGQGGR